MMNLTRFRVQNFRSFIDTGWVECQNVTAFAGENESGKTSLLMALLKLMDSKNKDNLKTASAKQYSQINLTKDLPIDRYEELFPISSEIVFIEAEFHVTDSMLNDALLKINEDYKPREKFILSKTYGGYYSTDFLHEFPEEQHPRVIKAILNRMPNFEYYKEVTEVESKIDLLALALKLNGSTKSTTLTAKEKMISNLLGALDIWESNLIKSIIQVYDKLSQDIKKEVDFREIFEKIPPLKARMERGFEALNAEFLKWWGKDDISIGFEPYNRGVIIKIYDKDGNNYVLENRSTGFRRFFAVFLSFSVAAKDEMRNAILLFDEAGAALHPLTQKKLEHYFDELGSHSQIIYNTHTSYMLSVENLNRVRVVYKDNTQHSRISATLRINEDRTNELSLFPVQSALALYVAEKQMAGCLPIIVLNDYDENYLSLIKNILIAKGKLNTVYTILIFATGENGIDAVCEAFRADSVEMPLVLLPSDADGHRIKTRLIEGKYKNSPAKVLSIGQFAKEAETFEDLMPGEIMGIFSLLYLKEILGEEFVYDKKEDFLKQVEAYAKKKGVKLPADFRTEVAKRMKISTMLYFKDFIVPPKYLSEWMKIWKALLA